MSLTWLGQSSPRASFDQGRAFQGLCQQGTETRSSCQAVPWLRCRHCKHHCSSSSSAAALCSHVCHLSLSHTLLQRGKPAGPCLTGSEHPQGASFGHIPPAWQLFEMPACSKPRGRWRSCGELSYCSSQKGLCVHALPRSPYTTSVS